MTREEAKISPVAMGLIKEMIPSINKIYWTVPPEELFVTLLYGDLPEEDITSYVSFILENFKYCALLGLVPAPLLQEISKIIRENPDPLGINERKGGKK